MSTPARQPQTDKLKAHIQELKNAAFKVVADCESISIATHTSSPAPNCDNCHELMAKAREEGAKAAREQVLNVRPEVGKFAELMEAKLKKNDHKSHWSKESFTYLFGRLDDEMKELNQAVSSAKTDYERIVDESVDVANFLMMIVGNLESLRAQQEEQ